MSECKCNGESKTTEETEGKREIIRIICGSVIFAIVVIIDKLTIIKMSEHLIFYIYVLSYLILGGNIVLRALKGIIKGKVFDENFLMSIATIGAFVIGEYPEAVGVMLFYQIGELFQEMAVRKSKKSITNLMNIRPDYANLKKGDDLVIAAPDTVGIGDIIIVKPGEKIPLDGLVIDGNSMIDTSALTGESVPRGVKVTDNVLSGCVNLNGVLTIEVTKVFGESTVSKIIDLVENSSGKKAKTENFITIFARYYTPIVVIFAVLIAVLPVILFNGEWREWLHRSLVFLVISCPCALVLSIPMGFFAGIGKSAKNGILVKGGNFLESFSSLDTVVFDKTGTLTKGVFKVTDIETAEGFSKDTVIELAAYAERFSNHPIALSILNEYSNQEFDNKDLSDYTEISGFGVSVSLKNKTILAGNNKLMIKNGIDYQESQNTGTKVYVAADGKFAGCIIISDEIKNNSKNAISQLKLKGVRKTVMLTGDTPQIANVVAEELGIDEVYAGLLPHEKVEKVEMLNIQKNNIGKPASKSLAFVGDGINDAPVLAMADIGIAMGGLGSDAAIEAADVVLMTDNLTGISTAIDIAKFTKRIVWQNIIFALGVKGVFLLLGAFGITSMWEAVFADVGVSLLAVLNAMRILGARHPYYL